MDPNKLSDQFIPKTHFPLQTFVGMSKEAADHLHASGGKDWSKALDEHEAEHGVRGLRIEIHHPYSMETHHMSMGKQYGDPITKELYEAEDSAYRVSGPDRNDIDGAIVAVTLHPRNPVRFPRDYGGEPALQTPTEGHSGRGWKPVEPSMLPPHDVWEPYNARPTVDQHGNAVENDDEFLDNISGKRLVVTDPSSAMTYIGAVSNASGAAWEAKKKWNAERKASEQAAEDARKAKRAEAARKRRASKKGEG